MRMVSFLRLPEVYIYTKLWRGNYYMRQQDLNRRSVD